MTMTTLDELLKPVETDEPGSVTHIMKRDPSEPRLAVDIVMEARIMGHEIEALCGYRWIPNKDPLQLPLCQRCKDIFDTHTSFDPWQLPS